MEFQAKRPPMILDLLKPRQQVLFQSLSWRPRRPKPSKINEMAILARTVLTTAKVIFFLPSSFSLSECKRQGLVLFDRKLSEKAMAMLLNQASHTTNMTKIAMKC